MGGNLQRKELWVAGYGFWQSTFPQDGVWVRGLYLEGAGWDRKNSCLIEAEPMQLVCLMPTIHFRPTESRKKTAKGETDQTFSPSLEKRSQFILLHSLPF